MILPDVNVLIYAFRQDSPDHEKCPQHLEIPDLLEQVAAQFEGEGLRDREAMVRRFFLG